MPAAKWLHQDGPVSAACLDSIPHAGSVPYDPTLYMGAAVHYRQGRPPYPQELESFLARELILNGTGRDGCWMPDADPEF